ncbi:unnamed protein product [Sphenostylis stenocarpa]|uniref:Uncharacterized protein n=1 Tax=Sphenostylis stenocarpa TaxID=92480 RepID=A0AA86TCT7_9FABA|nr:unnamed protein product [Sphenostylis stenocarpa]
MGTTINKSENVLLLECEAMTGHKLTINYDATNKKLLSDFKSNAIKIPLRLVAAEMYICKTVVTSLKKSLAMNE